MSKIVKNFWLECSDEESHDENVDPCTTQSPSSTKQRGFEKSLLDKKQKKNRQLYTPKKLRTANRLPVSKDGSSAYSTIQLICTPQREGKRRGVTRRMEKAKVNGSEKTTRKKVKSRQRKKKIKYNRKKNTKVSWPQVLWRIEKISDKSIVFLQEHIRNSEPIQDAPAEQFIALPEKWTTQEAWMVLKDLQTLGFSRHKVSAGEFAVKQKGDFFSKLQLVVDKIFEKREMASQSSETKLQENSGDISTLHIEFDKVSINETQDVEVEEASISSQNEVFTRINLPRRARQSLIPLPIMMDNLHSMKFKTTNLSPVCNKRESLFNIGKASFLPDEFEPLIQARQSMLNVRRASFLPLPIGNASFLGQVMAAELQDLVNENQDRKDELLQDNYSKCTESKEYVSSESQSVLTKNTFVLSQIFEYLPSSYLLASAVQVSEVWCTTGSQVASMAAAFSLSSSTIFNNVAKLLSAYPKGDFLAKGGFKEVYKIWSNIRERYEAVAVMNFDKIKDEDEMQEIQKETEINFLLSNLVTKNICPNFVQTHQVFHFAYPAPVVWGPPSMRRNKTFMAKKEGVYQFTRMELCDAMDMEEYMKELKETNLAFKVTSLPGLLYQMCFSLYVARHHIGLCHYDVKLLNFLLKPQKTATVYHFGENLTHGGDVKSNFTTSADQSCDSFLVKLTDYGTAEFNGAFDDKRTIFGNSKQKGASIEAKHFTTFENAPIDFLLLGDRAMQGFQADTWQLGICFLHMLTGECPYEEIMDNAVCPEPLALEISKIWKSDKKFEVLNDLDFHYPGELQNTIYRIIVLMGLDACPKKWRRYKIWKTITKFCTGRGKCSKIFNEHSKTFSLENGRHARIAFARNRIQQMNEYSGNDDFDAMHLLRGMLCFDPLQRPSLKSILLSPLMSSITISEDEIDEATNKIDAKFRRVDFYSRYTIDTLPEL